MIKQIYFDAGKVIFTRRTPDGDNIAKLLGFPKEEYQNILQKVIELQIQEDNDQFWAIRTLDDEYNYLNKFHKKMCEYLKHSYDEEFLTKLSECRIKADFVVNEGVIETLEKLKEKYKLSILSNALPSRRHHELLMRNLINYFDPIVISFEIGVQKPELEIFTYALRQSSFLPSEVAFVDDKLENLLVAEQAGFGQGILFSKETHPKFKSTINFRDLPNLINGHMKEAYALLGAHTPLELFNL